jgi:hypothetical protein
MIYIKNIPKITENYNKFASLLLPNSVIDQESIGQNAHLGSAQKDCLSSSGITMVRFK